MNKHESAKYLDVSVRTLQRLTSAGEISAGEVRGRTGMVTDYAKEELDRYKDEQAHNAQDETRYVRPHVTPGTPGAPPESQGLARHEQGVSIAPVTLDTGDARDTPEMRTRMLAAFEAMASPVRLTDKLTLSLTEAALLSGLSRNHLRQAIEEKKLKARIIGRGWRVKRGDLDMYVKKL
jgi:excisionase family DNA binding protein